MEPKLLLALFILFYFILFYFLFAIANNTLPGQKSDYYVSSMLYVWEQFF